MPSLLLSRRDIGFLVFEWLKEIRLTCGHMKHSRWK